MLYEENLQRLYSKLSSTELFTITHEQELHLLKSPAQCAALNFVFGTFSEIGLAHARSFFQEKPFSCIIESNDTDYCELLRTNGYSHQTTMPEMTLSLDKYTPQPLTDSPKKPHFTVVPVDNYHLFRLWCITLSKTIALPLPDIIHYNEPLFTLNNNGITLLLGFFDNEPAATAMVHVYENSCCISTMTVSPEWRRNGLGSAMTHACLQHAIDTKSKSALLLSTAMGRPLYEKIGFIAQRSLSIFAR